MNHNRAKSEVRAASGQIFGEIRTYKFVDFTSQLKTGLSSIGKIQLVRGILGNATTYIHGNKVTDLLDFLLYRNETL